MYETLPLFPVLLPSVPFEERHMLPHVSGIYFALSITGEVLYIGKTANFFNRWIQHHRSTELKELNCTVIAYHSCPINELAELERGAITQFSPRLNGVQRTSKRHIVAFYVDDDLWLAFRKACLDHKISASQEMIRLIQQRLAQWETEKELSHD
jgi:excinuclease UvrABC nuclease subunit